MTRRGFLTAALYPHGAAAAGPLLGQSRSAAWRDAAGFLIAGVVADELLVQRQGVALIRPP
jgi:hypothetical protein